MILNQKVLKSYSKINLFDYPLLRQYPNYFLETIPLRAGCVLIFPCPAVADLLRFFSSKACPDEYRG